MASNYEHHRLRSLLWIINVFKQRKRLTFKELNKLWLESELSGGVRLLERTFFNYRAAIQDLFGLVIECDMSTRAYFIVISDNNPTAEWIISSFSVSQLIQQNKELSSRILLENIPSGIHHLSTIVDAMKGNNEVEITYQRFDNDEQQTVRIQPYCTKLFHQRWYVVAFNTTKHKLQTYALDRIGEALILKTKFEIDPGFDAKTFFNNSFGIYSSDKELPQRVVIKTNDIQSKFLRSLPLHHSQKEKKRDDGSSLFEYSLVPTKDFIFELLSYGANIEVVEPLSLRETMRETVLAMAKIYNN